MKLRADMTINGQTYARGTDVPWSKVYPFFLLHMLIFGGSGFFMAYATSHPPVPFLYLHGGFAIAIYTVFYLVMFGRDEVKWMFINAGLGLLGIYAQIDWRLPVLHPRNSISLLHALHLPAPSRHPGHHPIARRHRKT
jgi:hypothetical protein